MTSAQASDTFAFGSWLIARANDEQSAKGVRRLKAKAVIEAARRRRGLLRHGLARR